MNNSKYKIEGVNNIWYNDKDEWLFEQNVKTKNFWIHADRVFLVFDTKFDCYYQELMDLLYILLVKHLDISGYTTNITR
jgi:hypothetical protein